MHRGLPLARRQPSNVGTKPAATIHVPRHHPIDPETLSLLLADAGVRRPVATADDGEVECFVVGVVDRSPGEHNIVYIIYDTFFRLMATT